MPTPLSRLPRSAMQSCGRDPACLLEGGGSSPARLPRAIIVELCRVHGSDGGRRPEQDVNAQGEDDAPEVVRGCAPEVFLGSVLQRYMPHPKHPGWDGGGTGIILYSARQLGVIKSLGFHLLILAAHRSQAFSVLKVRRQYLVSKRLLAFKNLTGNSAPKVPKPCTRQSTT